MDKWQIVLLIAALIIWVYLKEFKLPKPYQHRSCMGKKWKLMFPEAKNKDIRLFLTCFVEGMAFDEADKLKFEPQDKIIDVYKNIYGGKIPRGDEMECEYFVQSVAEEFEMDLDQVMKAWSEDTTLGEFFDFISKNKGWL